MDGNGVVPRLMLHLANLHNGVSDSLEVAAVAIGSPVDDVEGRDGGREGGTEGGRNGGREGVREESGKGRREGSEVY